MLIRLKNDMQSEMTVAQIQQVRKQSELLNQEKEILNKELSFYFMGKGKISNNVDQNDY